MNTNGSLALPRQAKLDDGSTITLRLLGREDVAEFLEANGVKIERRRLQLDEPIKALGETTVGVRLHPEVTAQLRVNVVRD